MDQISKNACDALSVTKKITFSIEDGKTHIIELNAGYFNE